jgi:hypothetical protein
MEDDMQNFLGLMAFVGLIAVWFFAVVSVRDDAQPSIETERATEPKLAHDAQAWSIYLRAHG